MKPNAKESSIKLVNAGKAGSTICRQCGKVNRLAKTGSLTSWLFSDNRCQCQSKQPNLTTTILNPEEVVLDGFEVLSVIGHGGMGTVFKVQETSSGKILAIKLMRSELAKDTLSVKRFEQEVEACMALSHENLPNVYGLNRTKDGRPYLVMDYLEGMTLQALLAKEGFLELDRALSIFLKVSAALLYARQHGIVHRDVKPSNIFILPNNNGEEAVKVLDFGIARVLKSDQDLVQSLTSTGEIFGSPLYMSPEQCRGEEVDTRSDIYSLGCVIYETLCGKPPFEGKNPIQTILKHLGDDEPESLVSKKLGVSNSLQNVVFKCLEKKPEHRYDNFEDLNRDLGLLKSGSDVDVKLIKRKRKSRSKMIIVRFMQLCIVLLFVLMALYLWVIIAFNPGDISALTATIEKNPEAWESYTARARLYHMDGRSSEALSDLNKALTINPNFYWALKRRAEIYREFNEYDKALKDITKAISISPKNEGAYLDRAILYMDRDRFEDAIKDCTTAIDLNPINFRNNSYYAYLCRAECYVAIEKFDLAIADVDKAESLPRNMLNPEEAKQLSIIEKELFVVRSQALIGKHRFADALREINRALAIDPKSIEALNARAGVYIEMDQRANADLDLTTVLDLQANKHTTYLYRGTNRMFMGQMKEAIEDLTTAVNAHPNQVGYRHERGYAYFVNGDYENALKDFRKNLELIKDQGNDAIPCAVGAYFCNQLLNHRSAPNTDLKGVEAYLNIKDDSWDVAVIKYLNDKISETEFRNLSQNDLNHLTKSNCYIGLKQYLKHNKKMATESFNWVKNNGDKTVFEFAIAKSMLKKIEAEG